MVVWAGKSEFLPADLRPREELMLQLQSEGSVEQNSFLGESRPSTDWMRPTTLWKVICFTQSLLI